MKTRSKRILIAIAIVIVSLVLSACNKVEFEVNFVVDGAVYDTIKTGGNETLSIPMNPVKEGYEFDGWYWDEGVWEKPFTANSLLDASLSSNMNVFAKWKTLISDPEENTGAHIHSLTYNPPKSATCATDGNLEYWYCSICDKNYSSSDAVSILENVTLKKHGLTHSDLVDSTCTSDGTIEYWHCSVCNKNYKDEYAIEVVSSLVVPKGHRYNEGYCNMCGDLVTQGLEFTLVEDNYSVTGYTGTDTSVVIPSKYQEKNVNVIGEFAFMQNELIKSVDIPPSIISIDKGAFAECVSLETIVFSGVSECKIIDNYAFTGSGVKNITIPSSVELIGAETFFYCASLETVTFDINSQCISIGGYAFCECSNLKSIRFSGNSLTTIGREAFQRCNSLEEITIPASVTTIGNNAFYCTNNLKRITVEVESVSYMSIDGNLYSKDKSVLLQYAIGKSDPSFVIPKEVAEIGKLAFFGCDNIKNISFESNSQCTTIGDSAFGYCTSLEEITIPSGVTEIGPDAFSSCLLITINCQATSQPAGWDSEWKDSYSPVNWGVVINEE